MKRKIQSALHTRQDFPEKRPLFFVLCLGGRARARVVSNSPDVKGKGGVSRLKYDENYKASMGQILFVPVSTDRVRRSVTFGEIRTK